MLQQPPAGSTPSWPVKNQRSIRPSQIGCMEIPINTKMTAARSNSERGRSAERIPSGIAISIQMIIPPKMSESVNSRSMVDSTVAPASVAGTGARYLSMR